jgi:hypothetical protein
MTDFELGWLIGLIEGEGCLQIRKTSEAKWPSLSLWMTDRDIVQRASDLFALPAGRIRTRTCSNRVTGAAYRAQFGFTLGGRHLVPWLRLFYPHMSERRRAKMKELLALEVTPVKPQRLYILLSPEERQQVAREVGSNAARKFGVSRQTVANIKAASL